MIAKQKLSGRTFLSTLALLAAWGFADQARSQEFTHKADGQFELHLPADGNAAWTFNGSIREGEKAQARSGNTTVDLRFYGSGSLYVVATEEGREISRLFLFARQNASFVPLNESAILGRTATLAADVETAVDSLDKLNKWDVNTTFRAIVAYFSINSTKQMTDFIDEVELGNMRTIPHAKSEVDESDDKSTNKEEGSEASERQETSSHDESAESNEEQDPRYRHMQQQSPMPYGGRPPVPGYGPYGPNPMQGPPPQYYYRQNPGVPPHMQQPMPQSIPRQRAPRQSRRGQAPQPQQQNDSFFPFNLQNPFF